MLPCGSTNWQIKGFIKRSEAAHAKELSSWMGERRSRLQRAEVGNAGGGGLIRGLVRFYCIFFYWV